MSSFGVIGPTCIKAARAFEMRIPMAKSRQPKDYYFIDIDLRTMKLVGWGETRHATHTGATDDPRVHRVFLTKGQFNKLRKHLIWDAV